MTTWDSFAVLLVLPKARRKGRIDMSRRSLRWRMLGKARERGALPILQVQEMFPSD